VHAHKPETIHVVHQERWNARHFLPEKETNMNLTTWMKTTFADARSSSAATQVEVQEPRVVGAFYPSETAKHADV
jgi:hypothetical protein